MRRQGTIARVMSSNGAHARRLAARTSTCGVSCASCAAACRSCAACADTWWCCCSAWPRCASSASRASWSTRPRSGTARCRASRSRSSPRARSASRPSCVAQRRTRSTRTLRRALARAAHLGAGGLRDLDRRRDHGARLLRRLDPAAREPVAAAAARRPAAGALAALPRPEPRRRRDLPHLPGQRDGHAGRPVVHHRADRRRSRRRSRSRSCSRPSRPRSRWRWPRPGCRCSRSALYFSQAPARALPASRARRTAALTSRIQESLAGVRVIKAYGLEALRAGALRVGVARGVRGRARGAQPARDVRRRGVLGDRRADPRRHRVRHARDARRSAPLWLATLVAAHRPRARAGRGSRARASRLDARPLQRVEGDLLLGRGQHRRRSSAPGGARRTSRSDSIASSSCSISSPRCRTRPTRIAARAAARARSRSAT